MTKTLTTLGSLFASVSFGADPAVGKWMLNVDKSKLQNPDRRKGAVMTVDFVEGTTYRYRFTFPDGRSTQELRNFDGKERPGKQPGITFVYQRIDDHHHRNLQKRNGKEIFVLDATISDDGQTLTAVVKDSAHEGGQTINEVRVYEKQ